MNSIMQLMNQNNQCNQSNNNMLNQFMNFKNNFNGNDDQAAEEIAQMLNSGKISRNDVDNAIR